MRVAGPDIILFLVGLVLFSGATTAILLEDGGLGGQTSALGIFDVTYTTSTEALAPVAAPDMRAATATFEVKEGNVTTVLVRASCQDPAGAAAPFALQIAVEGPNGLTGEGTGTCAGAEVDIPVSMTPPDGSVPGTTEAEARDNLATDANATRAVGTWTVTVSGARQGAPPLGIPVGNPSGNIELEVERYAPRLTPVQR